MYEFWCSDHAVLTVNVVGGVDGEGLEGATGRNIKIAAFQHTKRKRPQRSALIVCPYG